MRFVRASIILSVCIILIILPFLIVEAKAKIEGYQDKLARLKPDDIKGHYQLGLWCLRYKLSEQAKNQFQKVIELNPDHKKARDKLGYIKYKDKWIKPEDKTKIEYQEKLILIKENDVKGHYELGFWCKQKGLLDEAKIELEKAIKLDPQYVKARKELGYVKYKNEWVMKKEAEKLKQGYIKHEKYGWVKKEEIPYLDKGFLKFKDKWLPKEEIEKLRQQWENAWEIESEHYIVYTNMPRVFGELMSEELEEFYRAYLEHFQIKSKAHSKAKAFIFKTLDDAKKENADMFYLQNHKAYYRSGMLYMYGGDAGLGVTTAVRHEAAHHINHMYTLGLPEWIEEGLAVYAQYSSYENDKLIFGPILQHGFAQVFFESIEKGTYLKIKDILTVPVRTRAIQYGTYMSLVQFFIHAHQGRYREAYINYVFGSQSGDFVKTVYGGTVEELEKEWLEYSKTLKVDSKYNQMDAMFKNPKKAREVRAILQKRKRKPKTSFSE
ncbi:tetratricopeptide repeat protein [Planctomycetota bacterium]